MQKINLFGKIHYIKIINYLTELAIKHNINFVITYDLYKQLLKCIGNKMQKEITSINSIILNNCEYLIKPSLEYSTMEFIKKNVLDNITDTYTQKFPTNYS
jgi:hypothetical protein